MKKYLLLTTFLSQTAFGVGISTGPNNVYIEQIGTSNTINVEQVGGTNTVGGTSGTISVDSAGVTSVTPVAASALNYGTVTGSSNILNITQHGNNDWAQYNILGGNNMYTSTITGSSNQTSLTVGSQGNPSNNYNTITELISGDSNLSLQNLIGNYITSFLSASGNFNQVTQNITSTSGIAGSSDNSTINISGNSNIINTQQNDVGVHSLVENTTGSSNAIYTQQQGANNTNVNILTQGDFNTVTVRTSSATIVSPQSAIAR